MFSTSPCGKWQKRELIRGSEAHHKISITVMGSYLDLEVSIFVIFEIYLVTQSLNSLTV
jgi:hypothetical protein